eukprot:scaffold56831_cov64-Phaeocystis_antarctica.AAC.2
MQRLSLLLALLTLALNGLPVACAARRNAKHRLPKHDGVSAQSFLRSARRGVCAALLKRPGAYCTACTRVLRSTLISLLRAVRTRGAGQLHLAPRCHAYKVRYVAPHRCAVTNRDTPRSNWNCEHGQQGTFSSLGYLPSWSAMAGACLRRCAACKGCNFISLSVSTTKITRGPTRALGLTPTLTLTLSLTRTRARTTGGLSRVRMVLQL